MKKRCFLILIVLFSLVSVSNATITYPYPWLNQTSTYNVPGTPFSITKTQRYACDDTKPSSQRYYWEYRATLNLRPNSSEANSPRIEYIGCMATYPNQRRIFQMFPNGGVRELTDINQALYEPSRNVTNPGTYGQYRLFTSRTNFNGNSVTLCTATGSELNLPNAASIQQVYFWAGYGFLTQKDIDIVTQYQQVVNSPEIQSQPGLVLLDEQTMKWAMAQGNMFQYTRYYKVFEVTNTCMFAPIF